ncbi:hypothetical protein DL769_007574 [Monosporascus sp. CRB-8-3]|nr:hypothetical protein DL769_007574 [Monosporascus sp. CRB-8-3]
MLRSFRAWLKRRTGRRASNNDPMPQALQDLTDPPPSYDDSLSPFPVGGGGIPPLPSGLSYNAKRAVAASGAVTWAAAESARRFAAAADAALAGDAPAIAAAVAKGASDTALTVARCFAAVYQTNDILVTAVFETASAIAATTNAVTASVTAQPTITRPEPDFYRLLI